MTLHDNFVHDLFSASDIPAFMLSVGEVYCKCDSFVSFYYASSYPQFHRKSKNNVTISQKVQK
jgi:hypothetical protein